MLTLKGLSPEITVGNRPIGSITTQAISRGARMASSARHPGVRDRFELHTMMWSQPGRPLARRLIQPHPESSLNSKRPGNGPGESEASIVAEKPGNSGGAKGCRFRTMQQGTMGRTLGRRNS
jgi:hypothetical protein